MRKKKCKNKFESHYSSYHHSNPTQNSLKIMNAAKKFRQKFSKEKKFIKKCENERKKIL